MNPHHRSVAIGVWAVAACLTVGCAGAASPPSAPVEPTAQVVADLLRGHEALARPITVEVLSGVASATGDQLVASGYLTVADSGRKRFALTDKGRSGGLVEKVFEVGSPFFVVPVARWELVRIGEPTVVPRATPTRMVEFTYRAVPGPVGRDLLERSSQLPDLHRDGLHRGRAAVVRYADGWDLQRVEL